MARPTKCRRVEFFPDNNYFVPFGKPKCEVEEIILKVEELEAMRLKDIENLNQEQCAKRMEVSRQTFQNIIDSARNKVTRALTEGKAIKISGGDYSTKLCKLKCMDCDNSYEVNFKQDKTSCPHCGSKQVMCNKKLGFCNKWCK
ncbi:DUF134 domain-containing protein [Clostridium senegalense]|uniref:DUF134 domain-containing protein n=1 Tax=Clostridium senegalense TaxID=1465809 RepID=UPI001C106D04|nr:DUF134 domain-containing protein [Clostridium senegalense]MBU5226789.1 DUF134 domain-containing protein [Clostridium senegalense]